METNELNCKNLMIGDWVLHDGEPYQIRQMGIYVVDRDGEDYPAVCVGKPIGIGLIVERNEIQPIPLTPEILEKNGFVWNAIPFVLSWEGFGIVLYEGGNGYKMNCGANVSCNVDYVHQLQHIFNFCGIEKEIIL